MKGVKDVEDVKGVKGVKDVRQREQRQREELISPAEVGHGSVVAMVANPHPP